MHLINDAFMITITVQTFRALLRPMASLNRC